MFITVNQQIFTCYYRAINFRDFCIYLKIMKFNIRKLIYMYVAKCPKTPTLLVSDIYSFQKSYFNFNNDWFK